MPSILMKHFSSASLISDYEIRQLAQWWKDGQCFVYANVNVHEKCVQRRCSVQRAPIMKPKYSWRELWHTTASAQLSVAYHAAGRRGAALVHCWDSGARNTLSRVIFQKWTKALLLWKESCYSSNCSITNTQIPCCLSKQSHRAISWGQKSHRTDRRAWKESDILYCDIIMQNKFLNSLIWPKVYFLFVLPLLYLF